MAIFWGYQYFSFFSHFLSVFIILFQAWLCVDICAYNSNITLETNFSDAKHFNLYIIYMDYECSTAD